MPPLSVNQDLQERSTDGRGSQRVRPSAAGGDGTSSGVRGLYELKVRNILAFLGDQPPSFWFISLYLFVEYVRPQSIYPAIEGLPLGQVSMLLALGTIVLEGRFFRRFNRADGALVFFGLVVAASIPVAYDPGHAVANLKLIFSWFLIYYLISNLVDNEKKFFVFMLSFLLWSMKMAQHATRSWAASGFGFRDWGVTGAPGWFHNSGEFAIQMTVFVPLAVYFVLALRKYWPAWKTWLMWSFPASGVIGVLASSSRGGQIGMAAVVLVMLAKSKRRVRALSALILVAAAGWLMLPDAQKERFSVAGDDQTSQARLNYWEDGIAIMNENPVLGVGYDNWLPYYRTYYRGDDASGLVHQGQLPHNIFVEAGAELGYAGLIAFLLLIGATFYLNRETRRLAPRCRGDPDFFRYMAHGLDAAMVGYLVSGFFVTVLYYPYFWINLALTAALYTVTVRQVEAVAPRLRATRSTRRRTPVKPTTAAES